MAVACGRGRRSRCMWGVVCRWDVVCGMLHVVVWLRLPVFCFHMHLCDLPILICSCSFPPVFVHSHLCIVFRPGRRGRQARGPVCHQPQAARPDAGGAQVGGGSGQRVSDGRAVTGLQRARYKAAPACCPSICICRQCLLTAVPRQLALARLGCLAAHHIASYHHGDGCMTRGCRSVIQ